MYKVFINDRPIFFCKKGEVTNDSNEIKLLKINQRHTSKDILDKIKDLSTNFTLYLMCKNPKKTFEKAFKQHKNIVAAGGIVKNDKGQLLFIERLGKWDLPKGKVEKNENIKEAAIREIEEECGITNPALQKKIIETIHTYHMKGKDFIKTTHWFCLTYGGSEELTPQTEEDITQVKWISPANLSTQLSNTYGSIIDVFEQYE